MSKAQIMKEWPTNGFKLIKEFDGLPWQHMMWFARDEKASKEEGERGRRGEGETHTNPKR
jgi:hypothetical protein